MKAYFPLCLFMVAAGVVRGADNRTSATGATLPAPVPSLPEQVLALQQTVAQLQADFQDRIAALTTEVRRQQALIDTLAAGAAGANRPTPVASAPTPALPAFPTSDEAIVVVAAPATPPAATDGDAGSASAPRFPTTDELLVGPAAEMAGGGAPVRSASVRSTAGSYMNVSFNAAATFTVSTSDDLANLEVGDHDPQQRGFNLRNHELALSGAVDPYFEGFAYIIFKLDNFNETDTEVEEAFLQTTSLSSGLQLRAGQFFTPFGRGNPMHPHTWDFVDAPLPGGRFLGPDGLRGAGAQVAWLAPWPWYSQFMMAMQEGRGGTAYSFRNPGDDDGIFFNRPIIDRDVHGLSDFVWTGRWENSMDLSLTQTVVLGASLAHGPNNTGAETSTQLYGIDLFYKWKPDNAFGGWPFFKWQTEIFWRRYEAGRGAGDEFPVAEIFHDWGLYTQLVWGFANRWTAGLRADWLENTDSTFTADLTRQDRTRASAALTWYPTEFSKLRLQYNHDWLRADNFHAADSADSIFLQTEFVLGAHGAHKF